MMRQCVIHIGMTKTGSTAIQKWLSGNREALASVGIEYPEGAHHALSADFGRAKFVGIPDAFRAADLLRRLEKTQSRRVVVSAETLSYYDIDRNTVSVFLRSIHDRGFLPVVVAYVRPPARRVNSEYTQMIKTFQISGTFQEFLVKQNIAAYNALKCLAPWYGHLWGEFVAIPWREGANPRIGMEMLRVVGEPEHTFRDTAFDPAPTVNVSLGPLAVAACRHAFPTLPSPRSVKYADVWNAAQARGWNDPPFCGFDTAGACAFEELFLEDNDAFARRFWSRPWDEVFTSGSWHRNEVDLESLSPAELAHFDEFASELRLLAAA
jgi:hypothetical protein